MEHRCTTRINSELKLLIYKHNLPVAIGRVKNGSRYGVFVETDFMEIECEHQLKLEVLLDKSSGTKFQRIEMEALVIHKTAKGFGAEIDFPSIMQGDLFLEILQGSKAVLTEEPELAMVV